MTDDEITDNDTPTLPDFDPAQPYTIELQHPIQFGSKQIAVITLRPVTGADLRKLRTPSERPLAMVLELAGFLAGEVTQVIDKLQGPDLGMVMLVTNLFFAASRGIGSTP